MKTVPKDDTCVADAGGEDIGDLSDRDEDNAVMLPFDQRFSVFLVTLTLAVSYVITLVHEKILKMIKWILITSDPISSPAFQPSISFFFPH